MSEFRLTMAACWRMTVVWAVLCLFLAPALFATNTTIAVLNFANTHAGLTNDPRPWLSKALADLLISDLTTSDRLRVVTREDMQMLMQEADIIDNLLGQNALPDDAAQKLKQYLKVDWLVFGTYGADGGVLTIQAQVIDYKTGSILTHFEITGDVDTALDLEKALAEQMLSFAEGGQGSSARPALPRWTDSMPASERLYRGVDLFDRSDYTAALCEFQQALQIDPNYADARYWLARMYYYRQEYEHARLEYARFVNGFPEHGRVGDAIMEFVHSYECLSDDPGELIQLYRLLGTRDWQGVRVHNQTDYVSTSPLKDWVLKREQQALMYEKKYGEAFALLDQELDETRDDASAGQDQRWRGESARLMSGLAELSEDTRNERLVSTNLPYRDIELTTNNPVFREDLRSQHLKGAGYAWGQNCRILAPSGFCIKKVKARIERTNDPKVDTICRLQIRRYRYVDINTCWTRNGTQGGGHCVFDIVLPPGCTWFYLRPEYDPRQGLADAHASRCSSSFDGWAIEAELVPLGDVGRVELKVENAGSHKVSVDGLYARSYNGTIPNLEPGDHKIRVENLMGGTRGFDPITLDVTVRTGQVQRVNVPLRLIESSRTNGWQDPVCIADTYPVFKLRPQRNQNWRNGRPATWIDPDTGRRVVVWAHLDDLWLTTSDDGSTWAAPVNMPPPVNSAHVEIRPRLIRDERGQYCMIFLSDRGMQRGLTSYACWSKDLRQWSRPAMIGPDHLDDQDLIQTRNGQYVFIGTLVPRETGTEYQFMVRRSADLVRWSDPMSFGHLGGARGICLQQDGQDNYHLFWAGSRLHHWVARELERFPRAQWIPRRSDYAGIVAATVAGDRLVAIVGGTDEMYSGQETSDLVWSGPETTNQWQGLDLPQGVVDGMCDIAYDQRNDQLVLTWQVTSMNLNTVFPSGPVYCMNGRPTRWKERADMQAGLEGKRERP